MRRGPLLMLAATLCFTVMVGLVKVARQELSAFEIMAFRAVTALPVAFLLGRGTGMGIQDRRGMLYRCALGFGGMTCFFTASKGLSIADLSILAKLQPVVLALLAPLVLGSSERSGRVVWAILAMGLLGCGLLVGPQLAIGNRWGLWALAAAVFSAAAHVMVRSLRGESPYAMVFWFQAFTLVLALLCLLLFEGGLGAAHLPDPRLMPHLLGIGLFAVAGQLLMTRAYQVERASVVAAAGYTSPLFGVLGDAIAFGTFPGASALVGGLLVIGAGLVLVFGPHGRGARPTAPPPMEPTVDAAARANKCS